MHCLLAALFRCLDCSRVFCCLSPFALSFAVRIKNGTGRAGKSGKALRAEKWRQSQGLSAWKTKAVYAREKKEAAQDALYCESLTPAELASHLAKQAAQRAASGTDADAALLQESDHGTDDELERLRDIERAQFGSSSIKTKRDKAMELLQKQGEQAEQNEIDASSHHFTAHTQKRSAVSAANAAYATNAAAMAMKDPSTHTSASLRSLLQQQFGYDDFKPGQCETIMRVLGCAANSTSTTAAVAAAAVGDDAPFSSSSSPSHLPLPLLLHRNVLSILPTGGGKSLIYQFLSFLLPGLTLLVSPLLSLMKDQMEHLPSFLPGAIWSSELAGAKEVLGLMNRLQRGEIKVLFVSPEKLLSQAFQNFMKESVGGWVGRGGSSSQGGGGYPGAAPSASPAPLGLSLVVVDEVHCMAEWSHNFRVAYARLEHVLHGVLHVPRILGLTATATAATTRSVSAHLRIAEEDVVRAPLRRGNLLLSASQCTHESRFQSIVALLSAAPFKGLHSIIIYVSFQKSAEALAKYLQQQGFPSTAFYHAGLSMLQRHAVQSKFMRNKLGIVVATCAFGMGLDKRDVRGVIHAAMPRSMESYIQEIGRAGRDGALSFCHAMWDASDETIARSLLYTNGVDKFQLQRLMIKVFQPAAAAMNANARRITMHFIDADADLGEQEGEDAPPRESLVYVALDVEQLRTQMDLSEEVVGTILARLERLDCAASCPADQQQHHQSQSVRRRPWVRLVSCVHNTVSIGFHRSNPKVLAHSHPVVRCLLEQNKWIQPGQGGGNGAGISFDHERAGAAFDAAQSGMAGAASAASAASATPDFNSAEFAQLKQQKGFLSLNLIQAAMALQQDVGDVQRDIVKLKAAGEISVQWSDLSFLVQVMRTPADMAPSADSEEGGEAAAAGAETMTLECLVDSLHAFLHAQEASSSTKLSIMATALRIACVPAMRCTPADAAERAKRCTAAQAKIMREAKSSAATRKGDEAMEDAAPNASEEPDYFDLHLVMGLFSTAAHVFAFLLLC